MKNILVVSYSKYSLGVLGFGFEEIYASETFLKLYS